MKIIAVGQTEDDIIVTVAIPKAPLSESRLGDTDVNNFTEEEIIALIKG